MTKVTIKLETAENILGVFLHRPGNDWPEPLPGVAHSVQRELPDGVYHVSISGTGLTPEAAVKVTFSVTGSSKTRGVGVSVDGTLAGLLPFELHSGKVL